MNKNEFTNNLINFIEKSTCSFTCVKTIKNILKNHKFKELEEVNKWNIKNGKYFVTRNDASIIAVDIPKNNNKKFSIITTHCDAPSLLLKPNGAYIKDNYLKYNIMPYGGLLNYGWLDHPLSIAGRIVKEENKKLKTKIIDIKKTVAVIPSLAIHQNDKANINLDLNMQVDLQPIMDLTKTNNFLKIINENNNIVDYDLYLYANQKPELIGKNNDLLISPRIDNLASVYSSLTSFLESKSENIKIFCSFNNEEIGSLTEEGADSNFLIDALKRISATLDIDIASTLGKTLIISSDNTHAVHPNHSECADDTGKLYLGKGFAIIREVLSTTNSISASIIKTICKENKIKYQYATAKNDISGGSTLSGISLRHVSALSVDVGVPQLSMHSSIETCSIKDIYELYKMMKSFYILNIKINENSIKVNKYDK